MTTTPVPTFGKNRRYACYSDQCRVGKEPFRFEGVQRVCPKCGATHPFVGMVLTLHYLVDDPAGPINGVGNRKKRLACDTSNAKGILWLTENYQVAHGAPEGVNCAKCRQSPEWIATMETCCANENFSHTIAGEKYGA